MSVKWDPFRDLITMQEHMNRLFDVSVSQHKHQDGLAGFHPPADICENDNEIHLFVEIAGVDPEKIELRIESNRLILSGERKRPTGGPETYHQTEILMGPFHRSFTLPANVDPNGIEAKQRQGILEVILPKRAEPSTKSVPIKVK